MARFKNGNLILEDEKSVVSGGSSILPLSKNLLINGGFKIRQRMGSTPLTDAGGATAEYGHDRWKVRNNTTGEMTNSWANSSALDGVPCLAMLCTTSASGSASDFVVLQQWIEGYNFTKIAKQKATVSFWVRSFQTGTFCAFMRDVFGTASWVHEFTINSSLTWEYKTFTVDLADYSTEQDYTTGGGIIVGICLQAGSTYQTSTPDAWDTSVSAACATSNQTNFLSSTSNDFRITGFQVELGEQATAFEDRDFATELAMCQRYYEKSYNHLDIPGTVTSNGRFLFYADSGDMYEEVPLQVAKRSNPTMSFYSPATGTTPAWYNYSTASDDTTGIAGWGYEHHIGCRNSTATANQLYGFHYTADADF